MMKNDQTGKRHDVLGLLAIPPALAVLAAACGLAHAAWGMIGVGYVALAASLGMLAFESACRLRNRR